uniref:G_PROTEIN_RECEP_F1_2 domain-containing protein n=1 Tax=Macrostomum lignano TaxID=282301 RepID=A0A1I8FNP3_9PLAT
QAESSQSLNNSPVRNSSLCAVLLPPPISDPPRQFFVSNLAVADLLRSAAAAASAAELRSGGTAAVCWLSAPLLCDLWACVDVLCCTASIMSLCAISLDRTHELSADSPGLHAGAGRLAAVHSCVSVGPLLGWRKSQDGEQRQQCNVSNDPGYILFSVLSRSNLPLALFVFFYIRIYREAVCKQNRFLASGSRRRGQPGRVQEPGAAGNDGGGGGNGSDSAVTLRVHRGGGAGAATAAQGAAAGQAAGGRSCLFIFLWLFPPAIQLGDRLSARVLANRVWFQVRFQVRFRFGSGSRFRLVEVWFRFAFRFRSVRFRFNDVAESLSRADIVAITMHWHKTF